MHFLLWFQHENGIGGGASLIYSPEVVATIRKLYPGDINYKAKFRNDIDAFFS